MTDSWQMIPDEILINIFEYLHSLDYVRLAHVSNNWRNIAKLSYCQSEWNLQNYNVESCKITPEKCKSSIGNDVLWLFSKVYLSMDWNDVKFIENLVKSTKLKHLILDIPNSIWTISSESLTELEIVSAYYLPDSLERFPKLKALKFKNCNGNLGKLLMEHIHNRLESLCVVYSHFDLKMFLNGEISNLKKISLEIMQAQDLSGLKKNAFPHLRELRLDDVTIEAAHQLWKSFSHQLENLDLTLRNEDEHQTFDFQNRNAPNLKVLKIHNATIEEFNVEIPKLEHLHMYYTYELPQIISQFSNLKTLCIENCYEMDFSTIDKLTQLRHLKAGNISDLETVRHISNLRNLTHLNISDIDDSGCEIISQGNLKNLKYLEIDFENPEKSAYYLSHSNLSNLRIIRFKLNEEASKIFSRTKLELSTVILNEVCEVSHLLKNLQCNQIIVWTMKGMQNLKQNSQLALKHNKRLILTNNYKTVISGLF